MANDPRAVRAHGTLTAYTYHRCRCDECRSAWRSYMLTRRRRASGQDPAVMPMRIARKAVLQPDGCVLWTGFVGPDGYGRVCVAYKQRPAHRVIYEAFYGPVPEHLDIDHLCRNRACVSPAHLEPVMRAENLRRGREARRTA